MPRKKRFMPDDPAERLKIIEAAIEMRRRKPPIHWKEIEAKTGYTHVVIQRMFRVEGYDYDKLVRVRRGSSDWERIHAEIVGSGMDPKDACKALGVSLGGYSSWLSRTHGNGKGRIAAPMTREQRQEPPGLPGMGTGLMTRITKLESRMGRLDAKLSQIVKFLS